MTPLNTHWHDTIFNQRMLLCSLIMHLWTIVLLIALLVKS